MSIRLKILTILLPAAFGLLAGCQGDPAAELAPIARAPEFEVFEPPGKPDTIPVNLKYRLLEVPQVGQPFDIELTVVSSVDTPSLGFNVSPEDGLQIESQSASFAASSKPANSPGTSVISVTPTREGRFHLRVNCNVMVDGRMLNRVVPIAIQVGQGSPTLEQMGEIKLDADGNSLISLPAEISDDE
ncbi:MAG: hypothetical protein QNJ14_11085 [Woeseiaceae bacterium]|nr:hypothetical protein [Woeseiaceae bacterium]